MSTHSQQQLQQTNVNQSPAGVLEAQQRVIDNTRLLTLSRQPVDLRNHHHDGIYAKQLVATGMPPSPGEFYGQSLYFFPARCIFFILRPE